MGGPFGNPGLASSHVNAENSTPADPGSTPFAQVADASGPPSDDWPRRVNNPRATLLTHLAEGLLASIEAGDLEAARIAHDSIGRLLGSAETTFAPVVHVSSRTQRSGGER